MKLKYCTPKVTWRELDLESVICDSYGSGIDDYGYEDLDLTTKS